MKSDFSVFALFTAGLSCLAQVSAQWTAPVGENPSGNPIFNPGLSDIVPAGKPYTITWDPTTEGTVTILLLRGPSENVVPLYAIAEKVENSGTYVWTPSLELEPDTKRYGIQLIVDSNGQYQYSTQFGISNPEYKKPSSSAATATITSTVSHAPSSSASMSDVHAAHNTTSGVEYTTKVVTAYTTYCPEPTSVVMNNKTYTVTAPMTLTITDCPCTISMPVTSTPVAPKPTYVASMGYPAGNSSIVRPTGSMTVPVSLKTSAATTSSRPTVSTVPSEGAAGKMAVGFGAVVMGVLAAVAL